MSPLRQQTVSFCDHLFEGLIATEDRNESLSPLWNSIVREFNDLPLPRVLWAEQLPDSVQEWNDLAVRPFDESILHLRDIFEDQQSRLECQRDLHCLQCQHVAVVKLRFDSGAMPVQKFPTSVFGHSLAWRSREENIELSASQHLTASRNELHSRFANIPDDHFTFGIVRSIDLGSIRQQLRSYENFNARCSECEIAHASAREEADPCDLRRRAVNLERSRSIRRLYGLNGIRRLKLASSRRHTSTPSPLGCQNFRHDCSLTGGY
ncbi:MAG: hypothetical protein FD138_155 [Planctomycetota bacterium]|nr:MAG: hypothetical protein FD138_155 [Planctomycetota bacterium]